MTRKEQAAVNQEQNDGQNSPIKRPIIPTGRRPGGRQCNKPRGMSFYTMEKSSPNKSHEKVHDGERKLIDNIRDIRAITKKIDSKENSASDNIDISKYYTNETDSLSASIDIGESIGDLFMISTIEEAKSDKQPVRLIIDSPPE